MLLKVNGRLEKDGNNYWLFLKSGVAIKVEKCTPADGEGNYLILVTWDEDLNCFVFSDEKELSLFQVLKNIKGVGNVKASRILSACSTDDFIYLVKSEEVEALSHLPGIGERTAKRIVVEIGGSLKHDLLLDSSFMELLDAAKDLGYDGKVVEQILSSDSGWKKLPFDEALRWIIDKLNVLK
jgi:Holliday junction DNA helicase RuvA